MQANHYQAEHDEVVSPQGVTDYYPDSTNPHEIVMLGKEGGMLDAVCMDSDCKQMVLKVRGSNLVPNGSYQFLQTDDPQIKMVRESDGTRVLGYLAQNHGGGDYQFFPDLQQAEAYEHKGDAARTAGKVALGAVLVAGLLAVMALAAAGSPPSR